MLLVVLEFVRGTVVVVVVGRVSLLSAVEAMVEPVVTTVVESFCFVN